jgi:hypothetical protein
VESDESNDQPIDEENLREEKIVRNLDLKPL